MTHLRVKELAQEKGYNQKQLAEKAKLAPGTVNRYWNNYGQQVNLNVLGELARVLGVSIADLIVEESEPAVA